MSRVSRSSALASKATGFPIAKIAAKLAVGYLLDELKNDITRENATCFGPTMDYVVTKIPRFAFEKFPQLGEEFTSAAADKERRRSDGQWPHLPRKPAKMTALAGDTQVVRPPAAAAWAATASRGASARKSMATAATTAPS